MDVDRVWQQLKAASAPRAGGIPSLLKPPPTPTPIKPDPPPSSALDPHHLIQTVVHHDSNHSAREAACRSLLHHITNGNLLPSSTQLLPCLAALIAQPLDEEQLAVYLRLMAVLPPIDEALASQGSLTTAVAQYLSHSNPAIVEAALRVAAQHMDNAWLEPTTDGGPPPPPCQLVTVCACCLGHRRAAVRNAAVQLATRVITLAPSVAPPLLTAMLLTALDPTPTVVNAVNAAVHTLLHDQTVMTALQGHRHAVLFLLLLCTVAGGREGRSTAETNGNDEPQPLSATLHTLLQGRVDRLLDEIQHGLQSWADAPRSRAAMQLLGLVRLHTAAEEETRGGDQAPPWALRVVDIVCSVLHHVDKATARTLLGAVALLQPSPALCAHLGQALTAAHSDAPQQTPAGDALLVNATAVLAVMATSPPAALPWVPAMTQALRVWATMPQQPHTPLVLALVHAAIHTSTSAGPQPITQPLGSTGTDTECAVDALLLRSRLLLEVAAPHVPAEALQLRQHHTALQHHALQKTLADRPATSHSGHHGATACIFDQTVLCECIQGCTDGRPGGRHIASCCMSAAAYELLQAALRVSSCAWVSVQLMERVVACTAEVGGTQQPLETARCCALVSAWFDMHAQLPSGTPQQDAVGSRAATNAPVWQRPEASVEPDMVRFTQEVHAWLLSLLAWRAGHTAAALRAVALNTLQQTCRVIGPPQVLVEAVQKAMEDDCTTVRCAACDCLRAIVTASVPPHNSRQRGPAPSTTSMAGVAARCMDSDDARLAAAATALCQALDHAALQQGRGGGGDSCG